jgi:predicted RNase H-like HicB family nuclease
MHGDYPPFSSGDGKMCRSMDDAMREHFSLTFSFEEVEDGWVQVSIEEFPEVMTAAPTRDEARLLAFDALREYLASFPPGERPPMRERREAAWAEAQGR